MEDIKVVERFPDGLVTPPPSKSLGHRAVISAALAAFGDAPGESEVRNLGNSEDITATLLGVRALGAQWEIRGDHLYVPKGRGKREAKVDCGESGSTLRFLLPIAALEEGETVFTGRGRLLERPLDVYDGVFAQGGVEFTHNRNEARVRGPLRGGVYSLPGNVSSQFVSGLLFALPLAEEDSEIRLTTSLESGAYVDLTLDVIRSFGVKIEQKDAASYRIKGGQVYLPRIYEVEADYSQAAYFLSAAALGRKVKCKGLNPESRQGDRAILRVLREMGAEILWKDDIVSVQARELAAVTVDAREIPDLIPPIAVLCSLGQGTSKIVNAGRLRLKESDRLHAMARELAKLGAQVIEGEDSLIITGAPRLKGGQADAWGDHRIAMSMALAAIRCDGPVELTGWQSVKKSYPNFWCDFEKGYK